MVGANFVKYSIPISICVIVFVNHYSRDTLGALEKQLEADLNISVTTYSSLNSLYFLPNIIIPLFTGLLCAWFGKPSFVMLFSVGVNSIGNLLCAAGATYGIEELFYTGRFISGSVYELIDCLPVIILSPMFKEEWGLLVGFMNGCLRGGSVLSFVLNPMLYERYNVETALCISALISCVGILGAICFIIADNSYSNSNQVKTIMDLIRSSKQDDYTVVDSSDTDTLGSSESPFHISDLDTGIDLAGAKSADISPNSSDNIGDFELIESGKYDDELNRDDEKTLRMLSTGMDVNETKVFAEVDASMSDGVCSDQKSVDVINETSSQYSGCCGRLLYYYPFHEYGSCFYCFWVCSMFLYG